MTRLVLFVSLVLVVGACGPTIGDPCTTPHDCANGTCLTQDYAPGGSCSLACTVGASNTCPAGTLCVTNAIGKNAPGCMRSCTADKDCRLGYVCLTQNGSATPICIGPRGL
jgi:hypothetical protein